MIIKSDETVHFLTVAEHLQHKSMVYQDHQYTVYLYPNKKEPFLIEKGRGNNIYIDWFALRFGQKEQVRRKTGSGWAPIHYGCSRAERDATLFLPLDEIIDNEDCHCCPYGGCQYWSNPTGVKGRYAFNCILIRYRALGVFDQKMGLTLEEVSRIYGCTRERIRQIQDRAIQRMRHQTRSDRIKIFRDRVLDYRDYGENSTLEAVG